MIAQASVLVTLVELVSRIPMPAPPARRGRGRPKVYPDQLFLQALVIMIVRHLHTPYELLSVLAQPTPEMQQLRALLTIDGRFPTRHTWERRLAAIPASLPAQIACLGRALVALLQPWASCGRAAAMSPLTPKDVISQPIGGKAACPLASGGACTRVMLKYAVGVRSSAGRHGERYPCHAS